MDRHIDRDRRRARDKRRETLGETDLGRGL